MNITDDTAQRLAESICEERLALFANRLEKHLIKAGVAPTVVAAAVAAARAETREQAPALTARTIKKEENRRIDSIGRILVEFCFLRAPASQMVWPEKSDQDIQARREFMAEIVPRPLMRYFLVSVRGSIDTLDQFATPSLLFNDNGGEYERLRDMVDDRLEEFKGPFGSGDSAVNWDGVYEDRRFQSMALEIIETMRHKIDSFGLETYLSYLKSYHTLDPERTGTNAMHRDLSIDDARQLESALEFAAGVLWQITQ